MSIAAMGLAVPSYWLALLLMLFFSLQLGWLPVFGAGTPLHLIMPAITLALPTTAVLARIMRTSMIEELNAAYILTAHAKGLPRRTVHLKHAMRNSLVPVITLLSLQLGRLMGGAFIVETIFGWPGLGRLTVMGIFDRDLPVVLGAGLLIAAIYLSINFVVDLIHGWLDPRVAGAAL